MMSVMVSGFARGMRGKSSSERLASTPGSTSSREVGTFGRAGRQVGAEDGLAEPTPIVLDSEDAILRAGEAWMGRLGRGGGIDLASGGDGLQARDRPCENVFT